MQKIIILGMLSKKTSIFSVATLLVAVACWAPEYSMEETPVLSADRTQVVLPADLEDGSVVGDTLGILANRSWSATVVSGEDWLSLGCPGRSVLERSSVESALAVSATNNKSSEDRKGIVEISSEEGKCIIEVVQTAIVPRLSVSGDDWAGNISDIGGEFTLKVITNVPWSAEIDSGATLSCEISPDSGDGNSELTVSVDANFDASAEKQAVIVFSADGCGPVRVALRQSKAIPAIKFVTNPMAAEPGLFNTVVAFKTNADWAAEIISNEGFVNPSLSAYSGKMSDKSVKISYQPAFCFGSTARLVVRFTPAGGEAVDFTLTQLPVIRFRIYDREAAARIDESEWPFASPSFQDIPKAKIGTDADPFFMRENSLVLHSGYAVKVFSRSGLWQSGKSLHLGGEGTTELNASYMISPAIEGVRLSKVYFYSASSNPKKIALSVRKRDFTTVLSGGELYSASTKEPDHTWVLEGTEPNTEYVLFDSDTGDMQLGDLIFYYE